jgi:hypothetical protein
MKYTQLTLLPALALGFSACADQPEVVAPNAQVWSDIRASPALAVIYSNFGPGMAFDADPSHGWTINGLLGPGIGQQAIAQQFTPSADGAFSVAEVALSLFSGPNSVRVFLQTDAGGLPGGVIEEISIGGLAPTPSVITATSQLSPLLRRGTPYWLTVVAGADGVLAGWNWNSIGDVSRETFASTQGGGPAGPWGLNPSPSTRGAFQIDGTPLTPHDAIQLLMDDVRTLVTEGLVSQDQGDGLIDKLTAAIQSLNRDRANAACNQLRAFANQVNALIIAGKLSGGTGQGLMDSAESIRIRIGCA